MHPRADLSSAGFVARASRCRRAAFPPTEVVPLALVTGALTVGALTEPHLEVLTYLLLLTTVWAGLRLPPVAAALHGAILGGAVALATLTGHGPFAANGFPAYQQVLFAGSFVLVVVTTGVALALGRSYLDRTGDALAAAQDEAAAYTTLLDAVLESTQEGLVVVDDAGRVLLRNRAAARLLGISEKTPWSATPTEAAHRLHLPDGRALAVADLPGHRLLAGHEVAPTDFHVRAPGLAHGRIVEMSARALPPGPDTSRRALVVLRDVTADRHDRDGLANFAGTVAHDLYTPLTIIKAWSETLVDEFTDGNRDPDLTLSAARRIHRASDHMKQVIRDLLDYTVARDKSLHLAEVDLSALVLDLADLRRASVADAEIMVQADMVVHADRALMRQLFDNLIGNAVKYVADGVAPRIEIKATDTGEGTEIRISDNGIGIDPDHRAKVFAPYHRVDEAGHGTGLGLAICRRITDRHRGTIRIDDGPGGRGTTMVVTLPRHVRQAAPEVQTVAGAVREPALG